MKISYGSCGPYGMGWWGIKIEKFNTLHDVYRAHSKRVTITVSMGTRRAWDGYQFSNNINRAWQIHIDYGKQILLPVEPETDYV